MSALDEVHQINPASVPVTIGRDHGSGLDDSSDILAVEEPLEIRVTFEAAGARRQRSISVTMRTPGDDFDLAVGFLFGEGIVTNREQILRVRHCGQGNRIRVDLHGDVVVNLDRLERHFFTSSSCGVCGKTSLEAVKVLGTSPVAKGEPVVDAAVIRRLPETLRSSQAVFDQTGGLHAAALFDPLGNLLELREDVGRHNALDKLIGARFLAGLTPIDDSVLLLSGRASFELVQKAVIAGIAVIAAVGAPSSLAVELARYHGLTLLGFVRRDRFNVYTGSDRILYPSSHS